MKSRNFEIIYLGEKFAVEERLGGNEIYFIVNCKGKLIEIHPSEETPGVWVDAHSGDTFHATEIGGKIESFFE